MVRKAKTQIKQSRLSLKGEKRRQQILDWLVLGYTNREIAAKMGLCKTGLYWHMRQLFEQFDSVNRTELAVRYAIQERG